MIRTYLKSSKKGKKWKEKKRKEKEAHTPQNGIDAVPAWGPPIDTKFLTCLTYKEEYITLEIT